MPVPHKKRPPGLGGRSDHVFSDGDDFPGAPEQEQRHNGVDKFVIYLDLAINFSAEERKIVLIKIKEIITPVVSASHDKIIPGTMPKSKPFAVDTNIDGKNPKAFINTSNKKLNTIAHIPNEAI